MTTTLLPLLKREMLVQVRKKKKTHLPKYPKERWLSTSIGATDKHIHARPDLKVEFLHQHITIWGDKRHMLKANHVVLVNDWAFAWTQGGGQATCRG